MTYSYYVYTAIITFTFIKVYEYTFALHV